MFLVMKRCFTFQNSSCKSRFRNISSNKKHFYKNYLIIIIIAQNLHSFHCSKYTVCDTPGCYEIASNWKNVLNFSVSPCDDFASFVCGQNTNTLEETAENLQKNTIALLEEPRIDDAKSTVDSARALFQGCMEFVHHNEDSLIQSLQNELKKFGGMPLVPYSGYNASLDWMEKLGIVKRQLNVNIIFEFEIIQDLKKEIPKCISFSQIEEFGLRKSSLVAEGEFGSKKFKNYLLLLKLIVCFLREGSCLEYSSVDVDIKALATFEYELAKLTVDIKKEHFLQRYQKKTIQQLTETFPEIQWLAFMKELFKETTAGVTAETEVVFMDEEFFHKLTKLIRKTDKKVIDNYIGWRVIERMPLLYTEAFRNFSIKHEPYLPVSVKVNYQKLQQQCLEKSIKLFPHSIGKIYVEHFFRYESKQQIETMAHNILLSMKRIIQDNTWMDESTRSEALQKVENTKKYIAYPDWLFNEDVLQEIEGMSIPCDRRDYVKSLMRTRHYRQHRKLRNIRNLAESDYWTYSAAEMKAFYSPTDNSLHFAAGILQPPYYYSDTIDALNYGAQGFVIAHELSHGFHTVGNEFNGEGVLKNWWTETTLKQFEMAAECFVEQYGGITDNLTQLRLNGETTLRENIADNEGIRSAYEAYMTTYPRDERLPGLENFSHEQLFFVSYGRSFCQLFDAEAYRQMILQHNHLPGIYRILIPTSNLEAFARTFECPKGSRMNPDKRCIL